MALPDWIMGMLLRPGETFERARTEMRLSYWWILLSVFTVEAVLLAHDPQNAQTIPSLSTGEIVYNWGEFLLILFTVQSLTLLGAGRLFGWQTSLAEAMKFTGLTWVLVLVEDLVSFYPFLKQLDLTLFWISIPFILWRLAAQTAGVRRTSGKSLGTSLLIVLLATLPWQLPLLYLSWAQTFNPGM